MRRVVALVLVVGLTGLILPLIGEDLAFRDARTSLSFGFLLLAAYLLGDILSWVGLPKITGYILAGILVGPQAFALVSADTVADLKLIDDLALAFIALAAGGELRLAELGPRRRCIALTVMFLTVIVFLGVGSFTLLARPMLPFVAGKPLVQVLVVAALLGTFAVARSPSSAIAIISECKARGPFTEMVLGVTVVMDVLVIVVFAAVVSVGQALVVPGVSLDVTFLSMVFVEIGASILAGVLVGAGISIYMKRVAADHAIFILAVAFLVTFLSRQFAMFLDSRFYVRFHLEPMLVCLTAGFLVQNFSPVGGTLMERIDRSSLPIYVVFFSLTGAALNIDALRDTWIVAVLLVVVRAALIWVSAYLGALLGGDPRGYRLWSGLSFLTQAGVSLGLAGIVVRRFPEWGGLLATTIVAVIAVNQLIGPVGFKLALEAVGEAGAASRVSPAGDRGTPERGE